MMCFRGARVGLARVTRGALAVLALAALAGLPASCSKSQPTGSEAPSVLPPVPAPAGLAGELYVPRPNATWAKVRATVGGPLMFLPPSYPMVVVTVLGLPPQIVEDIDADVPTLGAVTSDGKSEIPVIAIHVKSGGKVLSTLTGGADAKFVAQVDAPSGVTLLQPKPGQTALQASLGLSGNYLLVGYAPDGLLKLGPYVTRTLPTKALPTDDATLISSHEALAGPLRARLADWWGTTKKQLEESDQQERQRHGGSAPTFGDPGAALGKADATFQAVLAMMSDLSESRVTLGFDDAGGHAKALLKPRSPEGSAAREVGAMLPGSTDALLDLPESVSVALMTRDSAEVRSKAAADQAEAIDKLFAGKLSDGEKKRVNEVLSSWSKGRGDWLTVGAELTPTHTLFGRTSVTDEPTLDKGVRATLDLVSVPAFAEPLKHWLGEVKVAAPSPLGDGINGQVARIDHKPAADGKDAKDAKAKGAAGKGDDKGKPKEAARGKGKETKKDPERLDLAWMFEKGLASFVLGPSAKDSLAALAKSAEGSTLRADPDVKHAVESLGNDAAFALLVLPTRAISAMIMRKQPAKRPPSNPVLVSFGRTGQDGWFRLDAAPAALREIAKAQRVE
jgi:hypothetical protein